MSNLNDDAILDFFSTLLKDGTEYKPSVQAHSVSKKKVSGWWVGERETQVSDDNARLNKQALSALLSPVLSMERSPELTPVLVNKRRVSDSGKGEGSGSMALMINSASAKEKYSDADTLYDKQAEALYDNQATAIHGQAVETRNKELHHQAIISKAAQSVHVLFEQLDDEFQVLFFDLAGLILAVPLLDLGGIINIKRVNSIVGRPLWYLGMQEHRGSQINVVDTCAWVMPEKYEALAQTIEYKYIALLGQSQWGLAFNRIVKTSQLKKSQIQWCKSQGKRPWLAGVVREQMCGILDVKMFVDMLNQGVSCQESN
ncbi:chemotaxis protein CheW [Shewanella surugensis]|uniref:Chemotaxis protein CheW n=1 Tax=Shewanella surugensis TaxID=212020 RepID=A0ABT0L918_9GAMM|nr:chemotaxis protein CheW [Shewanella surugensis]MCL1123865.1 chemotaxis protein CheW [Shewanella surugensis]